MVAQSTQEQIDKAERVLAGKRGQVIEPPVVRQH
jgi:hypothetical protein